MRVYLPATLPALAAAAVDRARSARRPCAASPSRPRCASGTPAATWKSWSTSRWLHAARASLRLLADDPAAPRRRVVLAADVPDEAVSATPASTTRPWSRSAAVPVARRGVRARRRPGRGRRRRAPRRPPCPPPTTATTTRSSPWTAPRGMSCSGTPSRNCALPVRVLRTRRCCRRCSRTLAAGAGSPGCSRQPHATMGTAIEVGPAGSDAVVDAVTNVPVPDNEPIRGYAPGSPERAALESQDQGAGRRAGRADHDHRRAAADGRRRPRSTSSSRTTTGTCSASSATPPTTTSTAAIDAAAGGRAGLAGAVLRRPGRDLPEGRRPAGRAVAGHASTRPPCWASPSRPTRPRSTRPAS